MLRFGCSLQTKTPRRQLRPTRPERSAPARFFWADGAHRPPLRLPKPMSSIPNRIDQTQFLPNGQPQGCPPIHDKFVRALSEHALERLETALSREEQFLRRPQTALGNTVSEVRISTRQMMIGLMGVETLRTFGLSHPPQFSLLRERLLIDSSWIAGAADLGILAWFTAICAPERLGNLFNQFDFDATLEKQLNVNAIDTTGLALFLAGVSHLLANQGDSGAFGQIAFQWRVPGLFRSRSGRFNDQMYTIYALTAFARAFGVEEPLAPALACANAICAQQGENGEWWFRYNKKSSLVVKRLPLCSLHQKGTAPLGLLALSEICDQRFQSHVMRGVSMKEREAEWPQSAQLERPHSDEAEPRRSVLRSIHDNCDAGACDVAKHGWTLYALGPFARPNEVRNSKSQSATAG